MIASCQTSPSLRRRGLTALAVAAVAMFATACAPATQQASSGELIDQELADALAAEGEVQFVDNAIAVGFTLQAHLMAKVIEALGGDASVVTISDVPSSFAQMGRWDNAVNLEVWEFQYVDQLEKYVDQEKSVSVIGRSPLTGEEGWYFPTYVMTGDPERGIEPMCPGLPNWEALNECKEVFATAQSGAQGQYMTGAEAWAPYYRDDGRIKNLALDFKMIFAGSEPALFAEWTKAYERGDPFLALAWKPSLIGLKYDMTRVEFPPYTDECWDTTGACQWPEVELLMLASSELAQTHPTAYSILENYGLTDADYLTLTRMALDDGMEVEEAVDVWMQDNPDIWQAWALQRDPSK